MIWGTLLMGRKDPARTLASVGRSWLNQIETIFGMNMRKVIRRGSFTSVKDLREKLLNFIAYFNRVFAKPFQWTYTGRPLQANLAA